MNRSQFRRLIINSYSNQEIMDICFDLGIDYELLNGDGKLDKVRNLIILVHRQDRLPELISILKRTRTNIKWEDEIVNLGDDYLELEAKRTSLTIVSGFVLVTSLIVLVIFIFQDNKFSDYLQLVSSTRNGVLETCPYHQGTTEETLLNLINIEEQAVQNENIFVIEQIYSPNGVYEDFSLNRIEHAISNYELAFTLFDYQETDHPNVQIDKILGNVAYASSGSAGSYFERESGEFKEYFNPLGSDHWYFQQNKDGCWKIIRLTVNAMDEPFPP